MPWGIELHLEEQAVNFKPRAISTGHLNCKSHPLRNGLLATCIMERNFRVLSSEFLAQITRVAGFRYWHVRCKGEFSGLTIKKTKLSNEGAVSRRWRIEPRAIKLIMKYTLTFVIGLLVGIGVHWYLSQPKNRTTAIEARENTRTTANDVGQTLKETFDSEKIKEELSNTGKVIREKTRQAGNAIADATDNARITGTIKTKLIEEPGLSAFKIDVDTTDGVVTLSGTVSSYEQIGKAMSLAWETEGVHKVVSSLQVKSV